MQHHWSHLTGTTVAGKYILGSFLGERRRSGIFEASSGSAPAAVLVHLIPAHTKHAELQERAWTVATELAHPGLLRVVENGLAEVDGADYVYGVTERPEDTVADVLPQRSLDGDEVRQILGAIVPALAHLHEHRTVHGAVDPASIVAVGGAVKLTSDSLAPAAEASDAIPYDLRSLGASIVEMLTATRPVAHQGRVDPAVTRSLPSPFRGIAAGLLEREPRKQWTLAQVEGALNGSPAQESRTTGMTAPLPPPVPNGPERIRPAARRSSVYPAHSPRRWAFPAGIALTAAALLAIPLLMRRAPEPQAYAPPPAAVVQRPAPTNERARADVPSDRPSPMPVLKNQEGQWAVVAAIYRDYAAATKRAHSMQSKWRPKVEVFPPQGQGRRYLVLLGSGLSRSQAERLQKQAYSAGLPRDTYVTKIPR